MSRVGLFSLCWFFVLADPAWACGPHSGFKIKNTVPSYPNAISIYRNKSFHLKLDKQNPNLAIQDKIKGMDVRVRWTTEVYH